MKINEFYFIPSSEFHAYLKQIKVLFSAVKKISYVFTKDQYDIYFFTAANKSCFENFGLNCLQIRFEMYRSCLTVRYGCMHV